MCELAACRLLYVSSYPLQLACCCCLVCSVIPALPPSITPSCFDWLSPAFSRSLSPLFPPSCTHLLLVASGMLLVLLMARACLLACLPTCMSEAGSLELAFCVLLCFLAEFVCLLHSAVNGCASVVFSRHHHVVMDFHFQNEYGCGKAIGH